MVKSGQEGNAKGRFQKPTLDEAKGYGAEIGMRPADVESWYDHFEANGWRVGGKALMIDWRAGLRNGKRIAPTLAAVNGSRKPGDDLKAHERAPKPTELPDGFAEWLAREYPGKTVADLGGSRDAMVGEWRRQRK
jgi:hypothetical protein